MRRQPFGSTMPRSPVRSHPPGANASVVACGSSRYPDMMLRPRSRISPAAPEGIVPVVVDDAHFEAGPRAPHRVGDGLHIVTG